MSDVLRLQGGDKKGRARGCRAGCTVVHVVVLLQRIRAGAAQGHADTGMSRARRERHRRVPDDLGHQKEKEGTHGLLRTWPTLIHWLHTKTPH